MVEENNTVGTWPNLKSKSIEDGENIWSMCNTVFTITSD